MKMLSATLSSLPHHAGRLLLTLALLLGSFTFLPQALAQNPVAIQIPTIINLYPNSGTTEQQARDAVAAANRILMADNTGFRMVVVRVNTIGANTGGMNFYGGDDGSGGGTAGDGVFTQAERAKLRQFGGQEINTLPNRRGIKLDFGRTPQAENPANPGISVHRDPTIILQNRANAAATGETIAHELGHVMTLGPAHVITDMQRADAGGHAPNVNGDAGKGNLMAPSDYRTGTALTPQQIAEMQMRKYNVGKCSTQFSSAFPELKDQEQHGAAANSNFNQALAGNILGLNAASLVSLTNLDSIQAEMNLAGVLPSSGNINATYRLGLNTDNNTASGVSYAGLNGVDKIVTIQANGDISLGTFSLMGFVTDTATGNIMSLPTTPQAFTDDQLVDADEAGVPTNTSLDFTIPKSALDILGTDVPTVATTGDGFSVSDSVFFDYDTLRWLHDPTLQTFGNGVPMPGQLYLFAISGLVANDPFTLFLDDTAVFSGMLDGTGNFSGAFMFPSNLSNDTLHFLTAQDSTEEFAYGFTCPMITTVPEPSPLTFLGAALCAACVCTAKRRQGKRAEGDKKCEGASSLAT